MSSTDEGAPRVTEERIKSLLDAAETQTAVMWDKELLVSFRLKSGFTVTGRAACVSPENFDLEKGYEIARQDAEKQLWLLEGYLLQTDIAVAKRTSEGMQEAMRIIEKIGTTGAEDTTTIRSAQEWMKKYFNRED